MTDIGHQYTAVLNLNRSDVVVGRELGDQMAVALNRRPGPFPQFIQPANPPLWFVSFAIALFYLSPSVEFLIGS
jgi:hypothetical protein